MKIIYTDSEGNLCVVHPSKGVKIEDVLKNDVPVGVTDAEIVPNNIVLSDRTFRNAWKKGNKKIDVDVPKSKSIAHDLRRAKRLIDFAPHDEIIALNIPGQDLAAVENARQTIRDTDSIVQNDIDTATEVADLKVILNDSGIL
jgi:hypothetical protein